MATLNLADVEEYFHATGNADAGRLVTLSHNVANFKDANKGRSASDPYVVPDPVDTSSGVGSRVTESDSASGDA